MPSLSPPRPKSAVGGIVELVVIVALAIGLALLIQAFAIKPYQIPSPSMVPTLEVGQRVLVNRFIYHLTDPDYGDIIVFHPPTSAEADRCGNPEEGEGTDTPCGRAVPNESDTNFIKRIVGLPGDQLKVVDGHPIVRSQVSAADWKNDVPPKENYIEPCAGGSACNMRNPITIPDDEYFMMGDNRGSSDDSRFWGPVPRDWIVGEAFLTYWPPDRIGIL
jgi:signal peptidase I